MDAKRDAHSRRTSNPETEKAASASASVTSEAAQPIAAANSSVDHSSTTTDSSTSNTSKRAQPTIDLNRRRAAELEAARAKASAKAHASAISLEEKKKKEKEAEIARRNAMAEAAIARAKAEQAKQQQLAEEEAARQAREKEKLALARMRNQLPMGKIFAPTLAYALKVESSHSKRKGREGSEEKTNTDPSRPSVSRARSINRHRDRARQLSVYDGGDWDELQQLAKEAQRTAGKGSSKDTTAANSDASDESDEGDDGEEEEETSSDVKEGDKDKHDSSHRAAVSPNLAHARTASSVARDYIQRSLTMMQRKEDAASRKLQSVKEQRQAKVRTAAEEKARKLEAIRQAREEELRRMREAMDAAEAARAEGAIRAENALIQAMKLAKAAKEGNCDRIRALAMDANETGGDVRSWVNRHDSAGSTAIFHATWTAQLDALHLLFNLGADPNHINNRHNTALHLACDRAHFPVIKLLLEAGANPLLRNSDGLAPYEMLGNALAPRTAADTLEMAMFIRQTLEEFIAQHKERQEAEDREEGMGDEAETAKTPDKNTDSSGGTASGNARTGAKSRRQSLTRPLSLTTTSSTEVVAPIATSRTAAHSRRPSLTRGTSLVNGSEQATEPTGSRTTAHSRRGSLKRPISIAAHTSIAAAALSLTSPSSSSSSLFTIPLQQRLRSASAYLAGMNLYISTRVKVNQSLRRVKMHIWSAIRFGRLKRNNNTTAEQQDQNEEGVIEENGAIGEGNNEQSGETNHASDGDEQTNNNSGTSTAGPRFTPAPPSASPTGTPIRRRDGKLSLLQMIRASQLSSPARTIPSNPSESQPKSSSESEAQQQTPSQRPSLPDDDTAGAAAASGTPTTTSSRNEPLISQVI